VTEPGVEEVESTRDDDEEFESEPQDEGREETESQSAAREPSAASWAIRGAVLGAVVGGAAGAGVGLVVARRPEALKQAGDVMRGSGRQVARAAAGAATEVVTSGRLNQLIAGDGNGDRSQLMKQTAREAGAEAAKAARDAIISLRREENR
jgi:hypothetical protein